MIGVICAIVIAIWFFRSARRAGKNGFGWAFIGIISYYIPNLIWQFMISIPVMQGVLEGARGYDADVLIVVVTLTSVLIGVLIGVGVAVLVHRKQLSNLPKVDRSTTE